MPKCDFSKVALHLYGNHILTWVFSCKFVVYFRNTFSTNTSGGLLLNGAFLTNNWLPHDQLWTLRNCPLNHCIVLFYLKVTQRRKLGP